MIYLFTVEDRFSITGLGTVLVPGLPRDGSVPVIRNGDPIRLRKPDLSCLDTFIKDLPLIRYILPRAPESRTAPVLLPKNIQKFDVPIGTEVFLLPGNETAPIDAPHVQPPPR